MEHLIKFIIELLVLIILYLIAVKQNKQGGRIKVLEYANEPKLSDKQIRKAIKTLKDNAVDPFIVISEDSIIAKEPSFQAKKKVEEQRMNEMIDPLPLLKTQYAVLKAGKNQKVKIEQKIEELQNEYEESASPRILRAAILHGQQIKTDEVREKIKILRQENSEISEYYSGYNQSLIELNRALLEDTK